MAGQHGYEAVTGGPERRGQADIAENRYGIDLPGLRMNDLEVAFRRRVTAKRREKSIKARVRFIQSLELSPLPAELVRLSTKDDEKAGYVDAGSLVSFVAGVSAQHKSDVLNSTLLAQLAANKKYDREEQTVEWYKFYRTVLENVGWVVSGFNFTKFKGEGSTFTADKVIAEILKTIATREDKQVIDATIAALKALDDGDGRLIIWNQNSTKLKKGNFQISACAESGGVVVMKLGAFYFSTDKTVTRVLWFAFSSSKTEMYQGGQAINLNEDVYKGVRQTVIDKLGGKAEAFVGDLDI
jgi:hypothetical protein